MFTKKMNLEDMLNRHIALHNGANIPDCFGVEVELEGKKLLGCGPEVGTFWQQHQDGSLRKLVPGAEAIEYISRQPYNMAQTEKAIGLLFGYLNSNPGTVVFDSYRTSVHVHVNYARTVSTGLATTSVCELETRWDKSLS
jgi:hypothetical protein